MPFVLLILRNLLRQKMRTGLTVLGMSIGITAVVALGVITNSVRASTEALLTAGGSDFAIGRQGASDLTLSVLTSQDLDRVAAYPEIEHVTAVALNISRVGSNPFFIQFGLDPDDLAYFEMPLMDGRNLASDAADEVMLGSNAADNLNASLGSDITIEDVSLRVVGIYQTGDAYLDGAALVPLNTVWEYSRKRDQYSLFYVKVIPGTDVEALAARIEADHPDLGTLVDVGDIGKVDQGLEIMDAINLWISILAIFIGGIAVMNTMVMAVFERTREFGILRAVGWRTRRILQMVVGESLVLCLVAAVLGSVVAVVLTQLIVQVPTVRAFLSPVYSVDVFLRGFIVGVAVAILGALYPAYRAASFSPAQAIRYE